MSSKRSVQKHEKSTPKRVEGSGRSPSASTVGVLMSIQRSWFLISLSLFATTILQSCLSPVYGNLAAYQYHKPLTLSALTISCLTYRTWKGPSRSWAQKVAVLLLTAPTLTFYLFRYSGYLGPSLGPLITGIITTFPLTVITAVATCKNSELRSNEIPYANIIQRYGVNANTISRIDSVVYNFATRYFNLPSNHTAVIQDATTFVDRVKKTKSYKYIIHDVFTGGAEPIDLFTQEFLQGLNAMLEPDGVIAINYAGDLNLPTAAAVVRTVLSVFPSCRLFREDVRPSEATATDFANMVMFCRKAAGPFGFRHPTKADFLGSQAREYHLLPQHEVDPSLFMKVHSQDTISKGKTRGFETSQLESALGHWGVMRSVLPDAVWENW
ncbi:MAG: hypothetical protein Q9201_003466 [Fulgogasparrea decipioides]